MFAAEPHADGEMSLEEMRARYRPAREASRERRSVDPDDPMQYVYLAASDATYSTGYSAATSAAMDAAWPRRRDDELWWCEPWLAELAAHAALLRDIVGNPFRPVHFAPEWRSAVVVRLALTIYGERVFDRLPALADALEGAGCHEPDVLAHCHSPGPHVRARWIVDLVLGRG